MSDEEVETGLTGNGGDGGCDGVYLFFNDVLVGEEFIENLTEIPRGATLQMYIIQAKNELGFREDAIMKWKTIADNLLQFDNQINSFSGRYTEKILDFFRILKIYELNFLPVK